ncbi:type II toxin-antitoxin system RatA family toxin [Orbus mooreae]|uniref:type II toxin-antitoxin system RatA family toxin n=1 Tax=Orbus mooreae TaxID=3074107 RepID=UPI00370D5409
MTQVFYEIKEPYSAQQMFDLVNDIDAYPQFVPDCVGAGITDKQDNLVRAYLEVAKLGFRKQFTTINRLNAPDTIEMALIEGPFKKLTGKWSFISLSENECMIRFSLDFEFKSKIMDITFTPIFKEVMQNMVKAFSTRAKKVYGYKG